MLYTCTICGYQGLTQPPYDPDGNGTYEICPCCKFHFGVSDYPYENKEDLICKWRDEWVKNGCLWKSKLKKPPEGWDPQVQLGNIK